MLFKSSNPCRKAAIVLRAAMTTQFADHWKLQLQLESTQCTLKTYVRVTRKIRVLCSRVFQVRTGEFRNIYCITQDCSFQSLRMESGAVAFLLFVAAYYTFA